MFKTRNALSCKRKLIALFGWTRNPMNPSVWHAKCVRRMVQLSSPAFPSKDPYRNHFSRRNFSRRTKVLHHGVLASRCHGGSETGVGTSLLPPHRGHRPAYNRMQCCHCTLCSSAAGHIGAAPGVLSSGSSPYKFACQKVLM